MVLAFLLGQLAVFSKLRGEVGVWFFLVGIAGVGFIVVVVVILVGICCDNC